VAALLGKGVGVRELVQSCAFIDAFCAGREVIQRRTCSGWSGKKLTTTIWACAFKDFIIAGRAECTFKRADKRARLISG
jgi:hypothetical protein